MRFVAGSSHSTLAHKVSSELGISPEPVVIKTFKDQEISVEIKDALQGDDVCVFQTLSPSAHDHLMELFILIDAVKRNGAKKAIAVIPYYSYGRSPEASTLIAKLLREAGADQIITIGLHDPLVMPEVIHLDGISLFCQDIEKRYQQDKPVIVSPDQGGIERAHQIAAFLKTDWAVVHKERSPDGTVRAKEIVGDVQGRFCILVDDIIDSGETLCSAAAALMQAGAKNVDAYCIHAVLSQGSLEKLKESNIRCLTVTDTIPHETILENSRVLSVSSILSEAVRGFV